MRDYCSINTQSSALMVQCHYGTQFWWVWSACLFFCFFYNYKLISERNDLCFFSVKFWSFRIPHMRERNWVQFGNQHVNLNFNQHKNRTPDFFFFSNCNVIGGFLLFASWSIVVCDTSFPTWKFRKPKERCYASESHLQDLFIFFKLSSPGL